MYHCTLLSLVRTRPFSLWSPMWPLASLHVKIRSYSLAPEGIVNRARQVCLRGGVGATGENASISRYLRVRRGLSVVVGVVVSLGVVELLNCSNILATGDSGT